MVFNNVYFSHSFNISFQLSTYQVIFLNLKNLFSHCFSTFFPFHKIQLSSCIGKCWYNYVIGIEINKKPPPFIPTPPPPPLIFHWYFRLPCLLRPPIYLGPKSIVIELFLLDASIFSFWWRHHVYQKRIFGNAHFKKNNDDTILWWSHHHMKMPLGLTSSYWFEDELDQI